MKINFIFCLLLIVVGLEAQSSKFNISLTTGVDWNKSKYTYPGGFINEAVTPTFPLGATSSLRIRKEISSRLSFTTGLNYSKKTFHPRLMLGGVYGSLIINNPEDSTQTLFAPYLEEHTFRLLEVPLRISYQLSQQGVLRPYLGVGFNGSFRINEKELYRDNFIPFGEEEGLWFEAEDKGLDFFGFSFNAVLGVRIVLSERLAILFEHEASIWEYRSSNEKFKKNGEDLFDSMLLPLSRLSLNFGLEYGF